MATKKIMIVGFELGGLGGTETVCKKLYNFLHKTTNVKFIFLKKDNKKNNHNWLNGLNYSVLECHQKNTPLRRFIFSYKLSNEIKKQKPDIIISIDSISCYISNLAKKLSFSRAKTFSWIHLSLFTAYKAKFVLKAENHLSISNGNTEYLIDNGVNKNKIFTIFNPFTKQEKIISRPNDVTIFIYIGRVIAKEGKNLQEMFNALSMVNGNWKLHIIGTGLDYDINYLKNLADKLKINKNILWHGWVKEPWSFVQKNIENVSSLLLTSTNEGFPMVLGEAISYGIYCISSDCQTGTIDIIKENKNGELYPVGDINKLSNILQSVISKKELPEHNEIKNTINYIYDDKYIFKIKEILNIIAE
ncbi:glycosyltransferase [Xenorhabdus bovienii]|nr:glycosyltransferase [Xenorhabdus bovienii]MDE9440442.1 glycosyltransferase [Xenorhabdus bovienii]MDE9494615.1 glycosyltransferase [Xenorhabdus bovienii]MDE9500875.1 glycosyltransferase [Xenorhabdus bovienii]MDE9527011.1 glycosyltransferase [Xenorhabdus bovienii]MDE9567832.1 glycosyltransferase [Xenorhabdus bovienii]